MEKKEWASIQPAQILEFSRKYVFTEELLPNFLSGTGLKEGMRIADIGCGTGAFTRYLYKGLNEKSEVIGIDMDESFISFCNKQKEMMELGDKLIFQVGDAYHLPFEDSSLDGITDHTLMVNLREPDKFIDEELRVLKAGGKISTVTFLNDYEPPQRLLIKEEFEFIREVQHKIHKLLEKFVFSKMPGGISDLNIYNLVNQYQSHGIKEIQINAVFPIFSPDDARYQASREEWITMQYHIQKWELERFLREIDRWEQCGLTKEELIKALELLEEQYRYECENCTWIFSNRVELIISGTK